MRGKVASMFRDKEKELACHRYESCGMQEAHIQMDIYESEIDPSTVCADSSFDT